VNVALWWQFDPGFTAGASRVSFTQSGTSTTLVMVRPIAHDTWPISTTGPTNIVFASGTGNSFGRHGSNHAVSPRGSHVHVCVR
jgi:hypothetical protein